MTYSVDFQIELGAAETGLTLLATIKTMAGAAVASGLGTIVEDPAGSGTYWWTYASFVDGTSYRVFFYSGATLKDSLAVSPSDASSITAPVGPAGGPTTTISQVRYRLMDLDATNPLLVDTTTMEAAIDMAVTKYSQDRPLVVVEDETGNGTGFFVLVGAGAVLASWADGFSDIQSIDYPAGTISATYTPTWLQPGEDWTAYRDASKTYLWLRHASPAASETVRITYTGRHTHTALLDTVPTADFDALCDLAAHCACVMLATKMAASSDSTIGADSVNHRDGQLRFKQQAEMWLKSYASRLGLATDGSPAGASAVADWDSSNLSVGRGWLTHSRRLR